MKAIDTADLAKLARVNQLAHIHTFHPNALPWDQARTDGELAYLSQAVFGEQGHETAAVAYAAKEFAQLAEIERHVSAVMAVALSEAQDQKGPLARGSALHDAVSCFAAEELNHSNAFYRYVRALTGADFSPPDTFFRERLALYLGDESPYVKLAALCCTAYIGESIITAVERRTRAHDPGLTRFLPKLLHLHNLDEERHVSTDHWVIEHLIPSFDADETAAVRRIIEQTEVLNFRLAQGFEAYAKELFGLDYTAGNPTHELQTRLTLAFSRLALSGARIHAIDEVLDEETRGLLEQFSGHRHVHV